MIYAETHYSVILYPGEFLLRKQIINVLFIIRSTNDRVLIDV